VTEGVVGAIGFAVSVRRATEVSVVGVSKLTPGAGDVLRIR
jgi:hypothetical protein